MLQLSVFLFNFKKFNGPELKKRKGREALI